MALRAAEVEVLFTADTKQVDDAEKSIKQTGQRIEKNPIEVGADAKGALASMDRVEAAAKQLVSKKTIATVDANIERGEKSLKRVQDRLDYLHSVETELDVTADIRRAEASLSKIDRTLSGLKSARAVMEVDADTSGAEEALGGVEEEAAEGGKRGGEKGGAALSKGLIAAIVAIPVVGAVAGLGIAAGKALVDSINDGLQVEARQDRLQALTGVSEADANRIGRAAGEAYANNFGESIESNMDTARLALQFNILDESATTRDAQKVVQGLAGIADVLQEDVRPIAQSVTTLLSTGLVGSAEEAYDLIAAGARNGANRNEDLVDTLTEYPALFKRLGLSGKEALGLVSQGMQAGARNSDLAADALKEFQIRATDASESSALGFETLGLSAEEMTAQIARGGEDARSGLDVVLDRLREMEDPVARNAAAVALFGTQAEDLGDALFAMDLSNAVEQLGSVEGAAQKMFNTLADNDASKVEEAQRNIEVAADGIKGALAAALSDPLGGFADWVSENRGPLLQFFVDLANGAIDFAQSATESFGAFVAGPLASLVDILNSVHKFFNWQHGNEELEALSAGMKEFEGTTDQVVDKLEEVRGKLNEAAAPAVQMGYLNDAARRTASTIGQIGAAADGNLISLDDLNLSNLAASDSGKLLAQQMLAAKDALEEELISAAKAGESQDNLTERLNIGNQALMDQLTAMGLTEEQARILVETYGTVPGTVETVATLYTEDALNQITSFQAMLNSLKGPTVTVTYEQVLANKSPGWGVLAPGQSHTMSSNQFSPFAEGGLVEFYANGGLRGLSPMQPLAQMVPPNTWRVVGDRGDVPELYAPLDGSARSWALLMEGLRRMPGVMPMADGGILGAASSAGGSVHFGDVIVEGAPNMSASELQLAVERAVRAEMNRVFGRGGL